MYSKLTSTVILFLLKFIHFFIRNVQFVGLRADPVRFLFAYGILVLVSMASVSYSKYVLRIWS